MQLQITYVKLNKKDRKRGKKIKTVTYPELVAAIAKKGEMQKDVAELLSLAPTTVSKKLKDKIEWTMTEIFILCDHYQQTFEFLFQH